MESRLTESQRSRLAERAAPRQDDLRDVVLPDLPEVPGMISPAEGRYLYWLTSRGYTGAGAVVEVGSWLGRSTIHLAAGLRQSGYHDALHCYDRFVWSKDHGTKATMPLEPGDDFQPYFERNVRPVYPRVKVYRKDLRDVIWEGGPIEILFLDAPKRLPAISDVLAAFGPSLVPGLSVIVMQDYLHFPSYALSTVLCTLGDRLEPIHVVKEASTVTMAVRAPLDFRDAQPLDWNFKRWTKEQALAAWDRILEPLPPAAKERLGPGITMLLHDLGEVEAAARIARNLTIGPGMAGAWRRWAQTSLYDRYQPIFDAAGFRSSRRPRGNRPAPGRTAKKKRRISGKLLHKAWRAPYLKSRTLARGILQMLGLWEPPATAPPREDRRGSSGSRGD